MKKVDQIFVGSKTIFPNTWYRVLYYGDLVKLGTGKRGFHFRTLLLNLNNKYVFFELFPVELLPAFPISYEFSFDKNSNTLQKRVPEFFEPVKIQFSIDRSPKEYLLNTGNCESLVKYLKDSISSNQSIFLEELFRQKVFVTLAKVEGSLDTEPKRLSDMRIYIPSPVIGNFFCFLSSKFVNNLFWGTLKDLVTKVPSVPSKKTETEVEGKGVIYLSTKLSHLEAILLWAYSNDAEVKQIYDSVGKKVLIKTFKSKSKDQRDRSVRMVFIFPLPKEGNWTMIASGIFLNSKEFLVCKIVDVDLKKLFGLEELTVKVVSSQREDAKGTTEVIKIPVKKIDVKSTARYDVGKVISKDYSVEVVESEDPHGESFEPVKVQEEKISLEGATPLRIFLPTTKDKRFVDLTTVEDSYASFSPSEEDAKLLTKKVKSRDSDGVLSEADDRLSLKLISDLMKEVEKKLGIQFEVINFELNVANLKGKVPEWLLTYADGRSRKFSVYRAELDKAGSKFVAFFLDQRGIDNPVSYPLLFGKNIPESKGWFVRLFEKFLMVERDEFRRFVEQEKLKVYFKKPPKSVEEIDLENWVERMSEILRSFNI